MEAARRSARLLIVAEVALFATLLGWLAWSVAVVDVEYYDGWDAVCNARVFAGSSPNAGFIPNRAPMMAWLLVPGEALRLQTGGDTLDPRPYHFVSALLHAVYLLGVYWFLCRVWDRGWAVLASFVAAIPTFMFFAYGPFLSLDILPGLLLLAMTVWMGRLMEKPTLRLWLLLVFAGALAALLKQTYGLFWMALPAAALSFWLVPSWRPRAPRIRVVTWIVGGAAAGGLITWIGLALALGKVHGGDVPFLLRPWVQITTVSGLPQDFPLWIYLRNAPAFGLLTVLLLIPGAWLSLRGENGYEQAAVRLSLITLPLMLLTMHLLPFREVRYLVFLSPLAALLIVPAVERLRRRRWTKVAVVALLIVECAPPYPWARAPEALRLAEPFYRHSELRDMASVVREHRDGTLVYQGHYLGFRPPDLGRLVGDRHNEIFHFGAHQLFNLENLRADEFVLMGPGESAQAVPPGTVIVSSTGTVLNGATFSHATRDETPGREHTVAQGVGLRVELGEDGVWSSLRGPVGVEVGDGRMTLSGAAVDETLRDAVDPRLVVDERVVGGLRLKADGRWIFEDPAGRWATPPTVGPFDRFLVTAQRVVYRRSYAVGASDSNPTPP